MAIDSDMQGADARLAVRFYKKAMPQQDETLAEGRPVFKEFDFVNIIVPGDALTEIDTYARDSHKQRFPRQWAHYQNQVGTEEMMMGTPIEQWPLVTRAQAEELRGRKFKTVEAVAHATDLQIQAIGMVAGMSPHGFREKAKSFLNLAQESAEASKKNEELESLKQENAKINEETDAKLAKMEEQMAALLAAVAEKKPRTRKPKVESEA